MSYILIDEKGNVSDFASNGGLEELRALAPSALLRLLDQGEADDALRIEIIAEAGTPDYIVAMLREMDGRIVLTNGVEEDAEEED